MTHPQKRSLLRGPALPILLCASLLACASVAQEAEGDLRLGLELVADGLVSPLTLHAPEGDPRLFVIEQTGQIRIIEDGTLLAEPFLDVADRMVTLGGGYDERGLLGLAFHPGYADNGLFYVHYSAPLRAGGPAGFDHTSYISEFRVSDDPNVADPNSERLVIDIDQPQGNHNGGALAFGPDGYLYIALGDGGGANDTAAHHPPLGHGQDVSTLLGSLLRIDVNEADGYDVPADNPLVGVQLNMSNGYSGPEARHEIYLWGLRNPYRFSFDRANGDLWIPDVGQNLFEEVNVLTGPGNLGWNLMEGLAPFDPANPGQVPDREPPTVGFMGEPLVPPVFAYTRQSVNPDDFIGITVIAGYVYRGSAFPELAGHYVFGDWGQSFSSPSGTIVLAAPVYNGQVTGLDIVYQERLDEFVMGFGEDSAGEIYVLTTAVTGPTGTTGRVYRVILE